MDNSWVNEDRSDSNGKAGVVRFKVILTVAMVLLSVVGVILLHNVGTTSAMFQSEGILVDFGNNKTLWTDVNYDDVGKDPFVLLNYSATVNTFTYDLGADGNLERIVYDDGVHGEITYENDATRTWGLWSISKDSREYTQLSDLNVDVSDYKIVTWAFMSEGEKPTIALDATGVSIYGYKTPSSVITLSPVATETLCTIKGGASRIIGTDIYSDYPEEIRKGHEDKTVAYVGSYTDPSYESIMSLKPDLVICDGSQRSHVKMAESLRNSNVNALVIYECKDMSTILDNVFIVGSATGSGMRATESMNTMSADMKSIAEAIAPGFGKSVMVSLGRDAAPFVAASDTYINDILLQTGDSNIFSDMSGWPQPVSEFIVERNPEYIIVIDAEGYGVDDYELFLSGLSDEWKNTDAYDNGNIYLLCEDMGSIAQRSSPRAFQLMEIIATILHPGDFVHGSTISKAIGDDYVNYIEITKNITEGS